MTSLPIDWNSPEDYKSLALLSPLLVINLFWFFLPVCFTSSHLSPPPASWSNLSPLAILTVCSVTQSCRTLCDPCNVTHQTPLSMEFSRHVHWSRLASPWPRDWTHISCIGRWIPYHWATWEAHIQLQQPLKNFFCCAGSSLVVGHRL